MDIEDDLGPPVYTGEEIRTKRRSVKTAEDFRRFMEYLASGCNDKNVSWPEESKHIVDVLSDIGLEGYSIEGLVKNVDGLEMPGPTDWRWVGEIMLRGLLR